ncbi:hypothetical protein ACI0FO_14340 [Achromobacter marplatensis]
MVFSRSAAARPGGGFFSGGNAPRPRCAAAPESLSVDNFCSGDKAWAVRQNGPHEKPKSRVITPCAITGSVHAAICAQA